MVNIIMGRVIKWLTSFGIIILGILAISSLIQGIVGIQRSNQKIQEAKVKVAEEQKKRDELSKQLQEVNSQSFTEQVARDKLGLSKPGETVIVLPDKEILRKLAPKIEEEEDLLPDPNWKRWLKIFL